ncbi:unnamed protein product, partial [Nesidiocoris tenuis]
MVRMSSIICLWNDLQGIAGHEEFIMIRRCNSFQIVSASFRENQLNDDPTIS